MISVVFMLTGALISKIKATEAEVYSFIKAQKSASEMQSLPYVTFPFRLMILSFLCSGSNL